MQAAARALGAVKAGGSPATAAASSAAANGASASLACGLVLLAALAAGCSPALDWRELHPAGVPASVLLPCRPSTSARQVPLAGHSVRLSMWSCRAADLTWALAAADVGLAARVDPALQALRESTLSNFQAQVQRETPLRVRGAAGNQAQALVWLLGRRPDGAVINGRFVVLAHGTQVFQLIAVGTGALQETAAETFFESLRVGP